MANFRYIIPVTPSYLEHRFFSYFAGKTGEELSESLFAWCFENHRSVFRM